MKLKWSELARRDLRGVGRFSTTRWGPNVAANYVADLRDAAKSLAIDPRPARPLARGFHIFRVRSHFLACVIDNATDTLLVVRVLHVAMDLGRHLP